MRRTRLASLGRLVVLLVPATVVVVAPLLRLFPIGDPDTYWHLATGDWLRKSWQFRGPDPFGTMATRDWALHEWLPELVLSLVHSAFGLAATALVLPLGIALVAVTVHLVCRQRASALVSAAVTAATLSAMTASLTLRPHLVTFALAAVTAGAWLRTADDGRARWWLVPLTWVWACSHGMWFLGPVIGAAVLGPAVVHGLLGQHRSRHLVSHGVRHPGGVGRWGRPALVLLLSAAAGAVTPVGPALLLAPLHVSETTQYIDEWRRPALTDIGFVWFLVLVLATLVAWGVARRRARRGADVTHLAVWTRVGLLVLGTALALVYLRTIPVGAAIVAPVAAESLQRVVARRVPRTPVRRQERISLGAAVVVAVTAAAVLIAPSSPLADGVDARVDAALARLPDGTVVCNSYDLGGWLIWRHPNTRPTIDGRIEVYPEDHMRRYLDFAGARGDWRGYLAATRCSHALLHSHESAAAALRLDGWQTVASSPTSTLLRRPSPVRTVQTG